MTDEDFNKEIQETISEFKEKIIGNEDKLDEEFKKNYIETLRGLRRHITNIEKLIFIISRHLTNEQCHNIPVDCMKMLTMIENKMPEDEKNKCLLAIESWQDFIKEMPSGKKVTFEKIV